MRLPNWLFRRRWVRRWWRRIHGRCEYCGSGLVSQITGRCFSCLEVNTR